MRPPPVMVLGVALLTTSALAVAGCGTRIGTTTSRNTYTITEPVTSLKIDNPVGNTQIEGTDTNTISVTEELSYSGNPPQTSYPITGGGHLTLSYTCPGVFDVNSCSVTYLVKVPRRLAVQVDGKVGSTTLTGLAGQLTLSSSTGNIDATGLTSATVTARANAGAPVPVRRSSGSIPYQPYAAAAAVLLALVAVILARRWRIRREDRRTYAP